MAKLHKAMSATLMSGAFQGRAKVRKKRSTDMMMLATATCLRVGTRVYPLFRLVSCKMLIDFDHSSFMFSVFFAANC